MRDRVTTNPLRPRRRRVGVAPNLLRLSIFLIAVSVIVVSGAIASATAAELHPEGFAGIVASRAGDEVGLDIEPDAAFGRDSVHFENFKKIYDISTGVLGRRNRQSASSSRLSWA